MALRLEAKPMMKKQSLLPAFPLLILLFSGPAFGNCYSSTKYNPATTLMEDLCPDGTPPTGVDTTQVPVRGTCGAGHCQPQAAAAITSLTVNTSSTVNTNSGVGTSSEIATDITTSTITEILTTGDKTTGKQNDSIRDAANISNQGSSNRATIGGVGCAAGANAEMEQAGSGSEAIADCQDDFKKAKAMAEMARKGGGTGQLKVDPGVMSSSDVDGIFTKFEKNFGLDRHEYLNRMLVAGGSLGVLRDILGSKFSEERLDQMLAGTEKSEPKEKEAALISSAEVKKPGKSPGTSLRDSLKEKLAGLRTAGQQEAGSSSDRQTSTQTKISLDPNASAPWLNAAEDGNERPWSIFDIVRAKLREAHIRKLVR